MTGMNNLIKGLGYMIRPIGMAAITKYFQFNFDIAFRIIAYIAPV
jgi:hypothetical protein